MNVTIKIPSPLRRLTNNTSLVEVDALTIEDALNELFAKYPDIKAQLLDEAGELRNFVNIFHNKRDIHQWTPHHQVHAL